jgi:hypothetical protein
MKAFIFAIMALGALSVAANAAPVKLSTEKMATITAGANPHEQTVTTNNGGVSGAGNSCSNGQTCNTFTFKTTGKPN